MFNGYVALPAAGLATRLKPLSDYLPKSLLPLQDKPIIIKHLERLSSYGVEKFIIILEPFLGSIIETSIIRGYKGKPWIKFLFQDRIEGSGPGYAVSLCKEYVNTPPLLVYLPDEWHTPECFSYRLTQETSSFYDTNGSLLYDVVVAIAPFRRELLSKIGNVAIDETSGMITNYLNKPSMDDIISQWGTTGAWAFFNLESLFLFLDELKAQHPRVELHMALVVQAMIDSGFKVGFVKEDPESFHFHLTDIEAYRKTLYT